MDETRRDYNVDELKKEADPRFERTTKEAIFAMGLYFVMVVLAIVMAYALCPKDMENMTYVMGLPMWFFAIVVMEIIVFVIAMVFNQKFSKEFSLDAKIADTEGK